MATDSKLQAEKLEQARRANADRNKARLARLEQIADGSDEAHAGEMQEQDGDKILTADPVNQAQVDQNAGAAPVDDPEPAAADPTLEAAPATDPDPEAGSDPVADPTSQANGADHQPTTTDEDDTGERVVSGVRYYLTIVNGKEKWLTKSQLIERAQKVESADEYLKNAAEAAKVAIRPDPSLEDDAGSVVEDDMEKTLSSAVLGDQEAVKKVASAFSDLQRQLKEAKKAQPSVTPDVVKEIDNRLAFRSAVEWFNGEFSKELADPFLKKLIYDKDAELAQSDSQLPYRERLKKAGDEVRSWINGQKGVQAKPSKEKLERKQTQHVNVPAASARQPAPVEDDEEESVETVIQNMAKGRGQSRAIVHRNLTTK